MEQNQIIGLVALWFVIKFTEFALDWSRKGKSVLTPDERMWLKDLHDMHSHIDESGRPLWYFPRENTEQHQAIIDLQRESLKELSKIANTLDQVSKRLDKMNGS